MYIEFFFQRANGGFKPPSLAMPLICLSMPVLQKHIITLLYM